MFYLGFSYFSHFNYQLDNKQKKLKIIKMSSTNQSFLNSSRNTSRRSSLLFSNRDNLNDSMASRQSKEDSLISTNRYKSPFYEGKVSFGGSSAKRVRLSQVLPYNLANKPTNVTRIKDSDINRLNEFDQLSSATKVMLQNIYKASSPLEDAKKIPVFNTSASNQSNEKFMIDNKPFKRLSNLRTPKLISNLKTSSPIDREKLQLKWEELENSTNAQSINTSLQQHQNNLIADASSSSSSYFYHHQDQSSAGGKMRNKISRTNRLGKWSEKDNKNNDDDYLQQHNFPNISLSINSLPTFNFNKRLQQQPNNQFNKSNVNNNSRINEVTSLKRPLISITQDNDSLDNYDEFKFSAPKAIKLEKISDSFYKESIRKDIVQSSFNQLSCNKTNDNNQQQQQKSLISSSSSILTTLPTTTSSSIIKTTLPPTSTAATDQFINLETNKTVGMYKLDKLDTDFNPKENKATLANTNLPIRSSVDTKLSNTFNFDGLTNFNKSVCLSLNKKWECDTCSVRNELSATKCAACEQPRLKESKEKNVNSIYSNYSFGTINTEKKGFNAFKLDSKSQQQQQLSSIVSTNSDNSALSNVLSTVNSTTIPTIITSSFNNNNSGLSIALTSNNNSKIESINDKLTLNSTLNSSSNESTIKNKSNEQTNKEAATKPFSFITNEVADKIDNNKSTLSLTAKSTTTTKPINTWGAQFAPPKGNWTCDACLVSNKPDLKQCASCETPNPDHEKSKDDNKKSTTSLTFNTSSTGGFKFNLTPSTTVSSSTTKTEFGSSFMNKTSSTDSNQQQITAKPASTGFSFSNLAAAASTTATNKQATENNTTSKPNFSFGTAPLNSSNNSDSLLDAFWSSGTSNSWKCVNCTSMNQSKDTKCVKCNQAKGEPIKELTNLINNKSIESNLFQKSTTEISSSSNSKNTSSIFSLPTTAAPTFTFGQPAKDSIANKTSTQEQISKPVSLSNFVFGVSSANNLNNGELSFNPLTSNTNPQQAQQTNLTSNTQSSGFFNNLTATTSVPSTNLNNFNFASKAQFGSLSSSTTAAAALSSTNLFSQSTNNLTNGFASTADQQQSNNLFSSSATSNNNQQQPLANFSGTVFSQVPTFNFGSTTDQTANQNNVFQFSA